MGSRDDNTNVWIEIRNGSIIISCYRSRLDMDIKIELMDRMDCRLISNVCLCSQRLAGDERKRA